jgi:hypothetical protein
VSLRAGKIFRLGKSAWEYRLGKNSLEEVDAGLFHSPENVYTEYIDPRHDEWETKIRPALQKSPLSRQQKETGLSPRMLINARTGRSRPHPDNQELLTDLVRKLGMLG